MTAADPHVFRVDMFSSMHDVVVSRESKTLRIMPFATDLLEPYRPRANFPRRKTPDIAATPIHGTILFNIK